MRTSPLRLLVVDDDLLQARLLKANLDRHGRLRVDVCASALEALERLSSQPYDAVLSDVSMPDVDGIELVRRIRETDAGLPVFLFTAYATLEKAVMGIRVGATDFLPKPVSVEAVLALVDRAVAERPLREELTSADARMPAEYVVGTHALLEGVRRCARQVAQVPNARVLVIGESGTGKSLLARAIHELSGVPGLFVEVNCAALPAQLLESELFGHEKGAFTDAKTLKRGLVEHAHNGTLLLDEIGAMPLELQAKLLLVLERQEIRRIGGTRPVPVTCRFLAATNMELREQVRERVFRADLYYRLEVTSIRMPSLREMPSVIPELATRFVHDLCAEFHRPVPMLDDLSFARLGQHAWPGNARELRNAVERSLIFHSEGPLRVEPPVWSGDGDQGPGGVRLPPGLTLDETERRYLAAALAEAGDRGLEQVARSLGISRKTLWEKRRRYGL
ncbi:MAG TPA: sigma-54 dependent transcriptional regulator [Gemmatimonadota bacterium]|nr:sigma-54 dependent transcriptional regulator [Gemmatimonadota bacterium]